MSEFYRIDQHPNFKDEEARVREREAREQEVEESNRLVGRRVTEVQSFLSSTERTWTDQDVAKARASISGYSVADATLALVKKAPENWKDSAPLLVALLEKLQEPENPE